MVNADTPARRLLTALRSYAETHPKKRFFRLNQAVGHLPPEDQLTEPQLRDLLEGSSEFKLLRNAMIQRVS